MGSQIMIMRLNAILSSLGRQFTWPWLTAFALLAACAGFYISVVLPERNAIEGFKWQLVSMQHNEKRLKQASQTLADQAPASQLDRFYQNFPFEQVVPDSIESLIDLAEKQTLNPKQATYHIVRNNPGELLSYQIMLPIKGSYPKIMRFTLQTLAKIPYLSLDNVSFQRQKVGDNELEAILWMTIYIKKGAAS